MSWRAAAPRGSTRRAGRAAPWPPRPCEAEAAVRPGAQGATDRRGEARRTFAAPAACWAVVAPCAAPASAPGALRQASRGVSTRARQASAGTARRAPGAWAGRERRRRLPCALRGALLGRVAGGLELVQQQVLAGRLLAREVRPDVTPRDDGQQLRTREARGGGLCDVLRAFHVRVGLAQGEEERDGAQLQEVGVGRLQRRAQRLGEAPAAQHHVVLLQRNVQVCGHAFAQPFYRLHGPAAPVRGAGSGKCNTTRGYLYVPLQQGRALHKHAWQRDGVRPGRRSCVATGHRPAARGWRGRGRRGFPIRQDARSLPRGFRAVAGRVRPHPAALRQIPADSAAAGR